MRARWAMDYVRLGWTAEHPHVGRAVRAFDAEDSAATAPPGVLPGTWCRVLAVGLRKGKVEGYRVDRAGCLVVVSASHVAEVGPKIGEGS